MLTKQTLQESKYPSDSFSSVGSYDSSSQLLPGKSTISVPISMYSSEYKPGDLIEFTFVVTDYYGNQFSSIVKQVAVD
jgi:hypothetical protein